MNAAAEAFVLEGMSQRDLEGALIGAIIGTRHYRERFEEAVGILGRDDFVSHVNRAIWIAFEALYARNEDFAIRLIARETGTKEAIEMKLYLSSLLDNCEPPFVGAYARAIKTAAAKRQIVARLEKTAATVRDSQDLATGVEAVRSATDFAESLKAGTQEGIRILDDVAMMKSYHENLKEGSAAIVMTGWRAIDNNGGLLPGELITIVARPKVGKSALGQNLCANVLMSKVSRVALYFTLEMPFDLWEERWLQILCSQTRAWVQEHHADEEVVQRLEAFAGIKLARPTKASVSDLRKHCEAALRESGRLDLVVIDHADFIEMGNPGENLPDRVRATYVSLKKLAGEMAFPLVVLHQGSRESGDGPPVARGSEGPREVSDLMLGAWRPGMDEEGGGRELKLKAIVARRMPSFYTELAFDPETLVIRDSEA